MLERKSVQIPDVLADPEYAVHEIARLGGFRTILVVPLLREGLPIGMQFVGRPFDEATVLRVADAYQRLTDWHRRRPPLA